MFVPFGNLFRATEAIAEAEVEQSFAPEIEPQTDQLQHQELNEPRASTIEEWLEKLPGGDSLYTAKEIAEANADRGPCRRPIGGVCLDDVRLFHVR